MEERKPTPQATAEDYFMAYMEKIADLPKRCQETILDTMDVFISGILLGCKIKESA